MAYFYHRVLIVLQHHAVTIRNIVCHAFPHFSMVFFPYIMPSSVCYVSLLIISRYQVIDGDENTHFLLLLWFITHDILSFDLGLQFSLVHY